MARASVPKFGDWGGAGGNTEYPYTVCFDNARKGRSNSGKIMNPNDPQQNPSLFPPYGAPQRDEPPRNLAPQVRTPSQPDRKTRTDDPSADPRTTNGTRSRPQSFGGELPSNRTATAGSRLSRPTSYGGPPEYNGVADNSKSSSRVAASPIDHQVRGNRGGGVLPKFGDWEGKNGGGGEGYTQVFNKVREEKKVINGGMTPLPVQPEQSPNHDKNPRGGRTESMGVCCFPWSKK